MKDFDIFLEHAHNPGLHISTSSAHCCLNFPMHYHPKMELVYCHSGSFQLYLDKNTYQVQPGMLAIISPLAVHGFSSSEVSRQTVLHIPEELRLQTETVSAFSPRYTGYLFDGTSPELHEVVEHIAGYMEQGDSQVASYYAMILLTLCSRQIQSGTDMCCVSESSIHPLLQEILSYIQNHYKEPLTLDILSDKFSIGKSALSRILNTGLQTSLPELLNKFRMLEAGHLISHTQLPITRIAVDVGYGSLCSFNRNFQKHFGVSPREYRKQKSGIFD